MLKALLLKDINIIKKSSNYKRSFLFTILFVMVFSFIAGKESTGVIASVMALSMTFIVYSEDEKSGFLKYYKSLPVRESVLVKEKFLLNGLFILGGITFSLLIYFIMNIFGRNINREDIAGLILSGLMIYSIYSIYIPLIYKYSVQKSPIIFLIAVFILTFIGGIFSNIFSNSIIMKFKNMSEFSIILIIIIMSIVISLISYFSTIKILKNKDM